MANNSSVPYFNWFAEESKKHSDYRFSFVAMHKERPEMLDEMPAKGCEAHWIKFDNGKRKSSMIYSFFKLVKLFRKIKPDVVHTHLFDDSLPGLLAAKFAGIKTRVITKNDTTFHWYYAPKWVFLDKLNNWIATDIVAISNESREFILKNEKGDPTKVRVIHHGIPIAQFANPESQRMADLIEKYELQDKLIIGTVARLIEWKGYRYIIEAARIIAKKHPAARFLFVGTGDQQLELESLVKSYKLEEHVVFTGWVDRADVPSLYGIMNIYLHAASKEPFGFVIAEAMAAGLPIVSTKTGAALDAIVHKEDGYLVDEKDVDGIIKGIDFIVEKNLLRDNREILKRKAVELYSFDVMWRKHIELYNRAKSRLNLK
ncbi:MAG: glycosyltransferase [Pyrinomonadaceae bacterium]|nr:glycosyltransferase [Pyrinomonadaceae bacterium]